MARRGELILLDTHVWIWAVDRSPRLSKSHRDLLNEFAERLAISVVSCWEVAMLEWKRRITLSQPLDTWFKRAISDSAIAVLPLSPEIAGEAYKLPSPFHDDPADRMIVATARIEDALLLTEDKKILKYPHVVTE